ncbi:endonuclease NucS [Aestuariibacter halophilus]|uniref:Endonuclease NucS n=1 Tax=Fluctibacter halophilus TaxID=226011 RepID=A0ABS8G6J8_9ALTE|nr:endonuclease NucS domain-containing protein [Aestuariibacter halophilus]MCC2616175.1 endonuclease NucS [Aestuariibacter halophilus]
MSDVKLFKLGGIGEPIIELISQFAKLEKELQKVIENNMEATLGVRFLASEYAITSGRIDSLGIDENGCPVIVEYKRHSNENVINQGLFYLDWLLDHTADFQLLVMKMLGNKAAEDIEWSGSRLICIASDFNKYDEHAIKQIDRNIELMRYKYFGDDLLLLELINSQTVSQLKSAQKSITKFTEPSTAEPPSKAQVSKQSDKSHEVALEMASERLIELYEQACDFCASLGDDAQRKELKLYTAFKRIKNFASFHVLPQKKDERLVMYLKLNPSEMELEKGFTRDVTNKGHWGTGDLEVVIRDTDDLEKAKPLIKKSFDNN